MKVRTLLASLAAVVLLTACEDVFEDGSLQPDGSKPNLTVRNPTNNQTLTQSENLRVKITAVDKDKLKEFQVIVKGVVDDAELVNFTIFPDKKILELDTLLAVPGIRTGEYTLLINATDFRTNISSEEVGFEVE